MFLSPVHFLLQDHALPAPSTAVGAKSELVLATTRLLQVLFSPPPPNLCEFGVEFLLYCCDDLVANHREEFETVTAAACGEEKILILGMVGDQEVASRSARA
jgi:hypothetical protein